MVVRDWESPAAEMGLAGKETSPRLKSRYPLVLAGKVEGPGDWVNRGLWVQGEA